MFLLTPDPWNSGVSFSERTAAARSRPLGPESIPEQQLILATCRDEKQQVELLERFGREGLECRAPLS